MKKTSKLVVALVAAFALAGCGAKDKDPEVTVISVGTSPDYAPYESLDLDQNVVGFDPDMLDELAKLMSTEEQTYEFELVQMSFSNIVTQLNAGQLDIGVSGFSYADDRIVEYSIPYTASSQVAIVNPNSDIKSLDQLKGKKIGVQTSTTGEAAAGEVEGAQLVSLEDVKMLFEGLKANNYDAVVVDLGVGNNYVKEAGFVLVEGTLADEQNFIVAKEGNTEMIELINGALEKFIASDKYIELTDTYGLSAIK